MHNECIPDLFSGGVFSRTLHILLERGVFMLSFIVKRILWALVTIWAIITITFIIMHSVPGDPFAREGTMPEAVYQNLRSFYNLDEPMIVQYGLYLKQIAQFDFGPSLKSHTLTVNDYIEKGFPVSMQLGLQALLVAVVFGVDKKPYLLDCTIMFLGILNHNLRYNALAYGSDSSLYEIVLYCVNRAVKMVDEVSKDGQQLLQPEFLEQWFPDSQRPDHPLQKRLCQTLMEIKKSVKQEEQYKHFELLDFIQDELFDSKNPRTFLIESALLSLRADLDPSQLDLLEKLIQEYLTDKEDKFLK